MNMVTMLSFLTLFAVAMPLWADDSPASAVGAATAGQADPGQRRLLIICGLSGDADHHKLFAETITRMHQGFTQQLGFPADQIQVLFGDEPKDDESDVIKAARLATREEIAKTIVDWKATIRPQDQIWVVVAGHSHYDGKHSWLNLPGADIQQYEFAKLFEAIPATQQIFVLTQPTSGFYLKPLSAEGRIIISATEVDWETNETEFPHEFSRVLSSPPNGKEFDVDGDGTVSLFDLYVTVARNLAQSYVEREFLATEHSLLDDNGDGRGTEVQIDFLTEEQGGRPKTRKSKQLIKKTQGDGLMAKKIIIPIKQPE